VAGVKELTLTKGYVALLDDEDYEKFKGFSWYADDRPYKTGSKQVYARRSHCSRATGEHKHWTTLLHREIMNAPPRKPIDHINGNSLDCRKENMRFATPSQNQANKPPHLVGKGKDGVRQSKYKGVCLTSTGLKWRAQVHRGGMRVARAFKTEEEAARWYDRNAIAIHGDFARTNFPRSDYVEQA
jgi:hypothetical protein